MRDFKKESGSIPGQVEPGGGVRVGDLTALLARVERAEGPDRTTDWELHCLTGLWGIGLYGTQPRYTESVDAALALCERCHVTDARGYGPHALDHLDAAVETMCERGWMPNQPLGPQLARYVVAALLKAKIAEAASPEGVSLKTPADQ